MNIKPGLQGIIGRTISGIVVIERTQEKHNHTVCYLTFDDGTAYEIYGADFHTTSDVVEKTFDDLVNQAGDGRILFAERRQEEQFFKISPEQRSRAIEAILTLVSIIGKK